MRNWEKSPFWQNTWGIWQYWCSLIRIKFQGLGIFFINWDNIFDVFCLFSTQTNEPNQSKLHCDHRRAGEFWAEQFWGEKSHYQNYVINHLPWNLLLLFETIYLTFFVCFQVRRLNIINLNYIAITGEHRRLTPSPLFFGIWHLLGICY